MDEIVKLYLMFIVFWTTILFIIREQMANVDNSVVFTNWIIGMALMTYLFFSIYAELESRQLNDNL